MPGVKRTSGASRLTLAFCNLYECECLGSA